MTNPYTFKDIARYEAGEMDAAAKAAFESSLAVDPDLQQQLALYKEVHHSLQQQFGTDPQKEQLQHTFSQLRKEYFQAPASAAKVFSLKRYLRPAISVAAAAIIAVCIWQPWQPDLFTSYARTEMIANVERGDNADTLLQQATIAFNKADFTTAGTLLEKTIQLQPQHSFANFYYGVALTQLNQLDKARAVLTALYNGSSAFKYDAAFYLALGYVRENNKAEAKKWLRHIPQDAAIYGKAIELSEKL
jgi:predicted Zn-dependent protease